MAQFYGSVKGCRGEATRLGNKQSGLQVKGNAWTIGAEIYLRHSANRDRDEVTIRLTGGSNNRISPKDLGTWVRNENGYTCIYDNSLLDWAVSRWHDEVGDRPNSNKELHLILDDTWRQVIRRAGGDDVALVGPKAD